MRAAVFCAALVGNLVLVASTGAPAVANAMRSTPKASHARVLAEMEHDDLETRRDPPEPDDEKVEETTPAPPAPTPPATTARKPVPSRAPSAPVPTIDPKQLETAVAMRLDELPMCRRGDAEGPGTAEVTFLPEGRALVMLSEGYASTATGACVARRLGNAAIPFDGAPVVVRVRFSL